MGLYWMPCGKALPDGVPMAWSCWDRLCPSSKGWDNDAPYARGGLDDLSPLLSRMRERTHVSPHLLVTVVS